MLSVINNIHAYATRINSLSDCFSNQVVYQTLTIALPFFSLYKPTSTFANGLTASLKVRKHFLGFQNGLINGQKTVITQELFQLILAVTTTVATIFQYRIGLAIGISYDLLHLIHKIGLNLFEANYRQASKLSLQTGQQALYFVSVLYPSPQILIISLAAQMALESYHAFRKINQKQKKLIDIVEICTHFILCGIYSIQLKQQAQRLPRLAATNEQVNRQTTQEELQKLLKSFKVYKETHPNQQIRFDAFLESKGLSTHLSHLDFSQFLNKDSQSLIDFKLFEHIDFDHLRFTYCNFKQICFNNSRFSHTKIENCQFDESILIGTWFKSCSIFHSSFNKSTLSSSIFWEVILKNCQFNEAQASFFLSYHSAFTDCFFKSTNLEKSKFISNLFINCYLKKSNFNQTLLQKCELTNSRFDDQFPKLIDCQENKSPSQS